MNRNIFLRMQIPKQDAIIKKEESSESLVEKKPEPPIENSKSDKYNPDVMITYEKLVNEKPVYELTNNMWKGITDEQMNFNPEISSNFICARDSRDYEKIKQDTEMEIDLREKERLENEEQIRILNENALESVLEFELTICEGVVDDSGVVFEKLKINSSNHSSLAKAEEEYNALVASISTI